MYILGISGLYHDSAAALIQDGTIIAAAQEERFTRKKHDMRIPVNAIRYCMDKAGITAKELECVVYYDNPKLTLDRYLQNVLALGKEARCLVERGFKPLYEKRMWIHKILEHTIGGLGKRGKLFVTEHHISHAASAFYPSPFEKAVIMTIDGVGEWATTTIGVGAEGNRLDLKVQISYPHSIGLFYSAFTYFCGFKVNSGDYKFMGLAPYGEPVYYDIIKEKMIDVKEDGSFRLNLEYFDFQNGRTMINEERFSEVFGAGRRQPESQITKREMDIAASVQKIVEEIIIMMARYAKDTFGQDIDQLVLAGGVALNCVANGKLLNSGIFKQIWIQPAAGDAGGALGAALYTYYNLYGQERKINPQDSMNGSYLGPAYSSEEIKQYLDDNHYAYHVMGEGIHRKIAEELADEKVIGLYHGRMEFGPRALGNRSIIADPRVPVMQSKLNLKIKYRESFRPFAPSVLAERQCEEFELKQESPYMLLVDQVKKEKQLPFSMEIHGESIDMIPIVNMVRSHIPAVTHVDYSARIQSVNRERNPYYYYVIKEFEKITGCPVIVNTSFNVRGEPIVCTPQEAYACFMRTEMDVLVLEDMILYKEEQPEFVEEENWRKKYSEYDQSEYSQSQQSQCFNGDGERMLKWAESNYSQKREQQILTKIMKETVSYWEERKMEQGIWEYGFETPLEIKEQLAELWKNNDVMQEMITISAVSLMKAFSREQEKDLLSVKDDAMEESEIEIPDYVYIF